MRGTVILKINDEWETDCLCLLFLVMATPPSMVDKITAGGYITVIEDKDNNFLA